MRKHLWMHGGLAATMILILGLDALGFAVPIVIVYAGLLFCPLMMASMMLGGHDHGHNDDAAEVDGDLDGPDVAPAGQGRSTPKAA